MLTFLLIYISGVLVAKSLIGREGEWIWAICLSWLIPLLAVIMQLFIIVIYLDTYIKKNVKN